MGGEFYLFIRFNYFACINNSSIKCNFIKEQNNTVVQSLFKVQWINTTLKYIKNDNQLLMEYPEMPVHHMEYLHNLIWQRKNDVGLGFKSMYAPVWEAMRIFSLKYKFKISVNKSKNGEKGHLIIQKIPKTGQENQEPDNVDHQNKDSNTTETDTSQDSPIHQLSKPKSVKLNKKFFIDKRKIIDSISPTLLRKGLQNILNFLQSEVDASAIFSDLAPVEASFYENFLGIYNKRKEFQSSLSPECNDIFEKMFEYFKEFDKLCKLEVYAAKYSLDTKKREVTFLKVPRYTRANAKEILKKPSEISQSENIQNGQNTTLKTTEPIPTNSAEITEKNNIKVTVNTQNNTVNIAKIQAIKHTIDSRAVNTQNNTVNTEKIQAIKHTIDSHPVNTQNNTVNTQKIQAVKQTIDSRAVNTQNNTVNIQNIDNHDVKLSMGAETIDKRFIHNNIESRDNRDLLRKQKEVTATTLRSTEPDKNVIPVKKTSKIKDKGTTNNKPAVKCTGECVRKRKLVQAMSKPIESDKALRMMKLMGWKGGALGLRGEGLLEPIIPALNFVPGKGLGHGTETPPPPPNLNKVSKMDNRMEFLKTILSLIKTDMSITSVSYSVTLCERERRCYKNIINMINTRSHFSLTVAEDVIGKKIESIMAIEKELSLDMEFSYNLKELTLTKSVDYVVETKADKKKRVALEKEMKDAITYGGEYNMKITQTYSQKEFKIFLCTTILEFLKTQDTKKEVKFEEILTDKYCGYVNTVCTYINKRILIPYAPVKRLAVEILLKINDCYLDVQFDTKRKRSFVLRKLYYQNRFTNSEMTKNIEEYIESTTTNANNEITNEWVENVEVVNNWDDSQNKTDTSTNKSRNVSNSTPSIDSYVITDTDSDSVIDDAEKKNVTSTSATDINKPKLHSKIFNKETHEINCKCKPDDHKVESLKRNGHKEVIVSHINAINELSTKSNNFETIDEDLIIKTVNSLTSRNKEVKMNKHNEKIIINDNCNYKNGVTNLNDNLKNTDSTKLCDKLEFPCGSHTDRSRKWYEPSETFLNCDDLVNNITINDPNNNRNGMTNINESRLFEKESEKVLNCDANVNVHKDLIENNMNPDKKSTNGEIVLSSNVIRNTDDISQNSSKNLSALNDTTNNIKISDEQIEDIRKVVHSALEQEMLILNAKINAIADILKNNKEYSKNATNGVIVEVISNDKYCQNIKIATESKELHSITNEKQTGDIPKIVQNVIDEKLMNINAKVNAIKDTIEDIESIKNALDGKIVDVSCYDKNSDSTKHVPKSNKLFENFKSDTQVEISKNASADKQNNFSSATSNEVKTNDEQTIDIQKTIYRTIEEKLLNMYAKIKAIEDIIENNMENNTSPPNEGTVEVINDVDCNSVTITIESKESIESTKLDNPDFNKNLNLRSENITKNISPLNNIKTANYTKFQNTVHINAIDKKTVEIFIEEKPMNIGKKINVAGDIVENNTDYNKNATNTEIVDVASDYKNMKTQSEPMDNQTSNIPKTKQTAIKDKVMNIDVKLNTIEKLIENNLESYQNERDGDIVDVFIVNDGVKDKKKSYAVQLETDNSEDLKSINDNIAKNDEINTAMETTDEHIAVEEYLLNAYERINAIIDILENNIESNENATDEEIVDVINDKDSRTVEIETKESLQNSKLNILQSEIDCNEDLKHSNESVTKNDCFLSPINIKCHNTLSINTNDKHNNTNAQINNTKIIVDNHTENNQNRDIVDNKTCSVNIDELNKSDSELKTLQTDNNEYSTKDHIDVNKSTNNNNIRCHDIIVIKAKDKTEDIKIIVQNLIEGVVENEFLPLIKYHGVLDDGVVYSCHNKDTRLWLGSVLSDYRVIDYKRAIDSHRVTVKVTSFNKDTKRCLHLLDIYNPGVKSRNWRVVYEKYDSDLLEFGVVVDRDSFEFICERNFSLFAGFDVVQFNIGFKYTI